MDTFSMIALGSGVAAGGLSLASIYNEKTSGLSKAIAGLTLIPAGLNIASVPAI